MSVPNGGRKSVCFPIHEMRTPSAAATASVKGRSQFDVWGAATTTAFGTSGAAPSMRQPKLESQARASIAAVPAWGGKSRVADVSIHGSVAGDSRGRQSQLRQVNAAGSELPREELAREPATNFPFPPGASKRRA